MTVPGANRILWEALDAIYQAQHEAVRQAQQAIARLASAHPELAQDSLARDALRSASTRQEGIVRYAASQLALAETMKSYWEQRAAGLEEESAPVPLVRRSNPFVAAPAAPRSKAAATARD